MVTHPGNLFGRVLIYGLAGVFAAATLGFGQDPETNTPPPPAPTETPETPPASPGGWHRFSPPPTPPPTEPAPPENPAPEANPKAILVPEQITIPAGTFLSVRTDQFLSSDKNVAGDQFSVTLSKPLIADGLVVSRPGQTLGGRVTAAKKAGRVKGVSQLQVTLNALTLADGEQVPVQTELTSITGPTSNGRDAAAVGATTATGAAIGAAADWGTGAAIGAGAGLVAGLVGVLVTRGRPTVIYPESRLTFRLAKPVTFSTARAPQAFVAANTVPMERRSAQTRPPAYREGCAGEGCAPPYPPPYYYYGQPFYPYFWGPSVGFYFGRGYYGRGYYGRGFYGRGFHR